MLFLFSSFLRIKIVFRLVTTKPLLFFLFKIFNLFSLCLIAPILFLFFWGDKNSKNTKGDTQGKG